MVVKNRGTVSKASQGDDDGATAMGEREATPRRSMRIPLFASTAQPRTSVKAHRAIDAVAMIDFCQRLFGGEQRPNAFQGLAYMARIAWADDIVKRATRNFSTLRP